MSLHVAGPDRPVSPGSDAPASFRVELRNESTSRVSTADYVLDVAGGEAFGVRSPGTDPPGVARLPIDEPASIPPGTARELRLEGIRRAGEPTDETLVLQLVHVGRHEIVDETTVAFEG